VICDKKSQLKYPKAVKAFSKEVLNLNKNVVFRKTTFNGLFKRLSDAPTKVQT